MRIKEASELTNLTVDTLRYYEKVGLIRPIKKQKTKLETIKKKIYKD